MIRIRVVTPDDADVCAELGAQMHAYSKYSHIPYARDKVCELVRSIDGVNIQGWIVTHDDTVVGCMCVYITEYYFAHAKLAQDLAVFVQPGHRNARIALMMLDRAEKWAREQGAHSLVLGVTAPHDPRPIGKLYERSGYTTWGSVYRKEFL